MLSVSILAVGRLKEQYLRDAVGEYSKRISAYFKLDIIEIPEARLPQKPSASDISAALDSEGEAISAKIPPRARVAALCVEGGAMSSEGLAEYIGQACGETSKLVFIIGSSHGLSGKVKDAAHLRLSMSPMTFSHQIARVMLCEQLYRAGSIINGGKYHK